MISANDLRNYQLTPAENGYSVDEVNGLLNEAATTITAYENENKELYHKLEVLAGKIEEYRAEEDSIKTALLTAQKMADRITKDASEQSEQLLADSKVKADATVSDANTKADRLISEAREYAATLIKEKTNEANTLVADAQAKAGGLVTDAESKANDAINSSKIVAQDILDQAKAISDDLITKSKEEKEAYELLNAALKKDAASFIENLKSLYTAQLEMLNAAKLDTDEAAPAQENVQELDKEVHSLVAEIGEMEEAIPAEIEIEKPQSVEEPAAPLAAEPEAEAESEAEEPTEETPDEEMSLVEEATVPAEEPIEDKEAAMAAVEAFSSNEFTPVETAAIPEIEEEEKSLFDEDAKQPFESYFNISHKDPHLDKTQTISLVPPDDYDDYDDDEPRFKGFFKKKR